MKNLRTVEEFVNHLEKYDDTPYLVCKLRKLQGMIREVDSHADILLSHVINNLSGMYADLQESAVRLSNENPPVKVDNFTHSP